MRNVSVELVWSWTPHLNVGQNAREEHSVETVEQFFKVWRRVDLLPYPMVQIFRLFQALNRRQISVLSNQLRNLLLTKMRFFSPEITQTHQLLRNVEQIFYVMFDAFHCPGVARSKICFYSVTFEFAWSSQIDLNVEYAIDM